MLCCAAHCSSTTALTTWLAPRLCVAGACLPCHACAYVHFYVLFECLQSFPTAMFVESAEGDSLGVITTKSQLDTLMHSLNRRGPREMLLHAVRGEDCRPACLHARLPA